VLLVRLWQRTIQVRTLLETWAEQLRTPAAPHPLSRPQPHGSASPRLPPASCPRPHHPTHARPQANSPLPLRSESRSPPLSMLGPDAAPPPPPPPPGPLHRVMPGVPQTAPRRTAAAAADGNGKQRRKSTGFRSAQRGGAAGLAAAAAAAAAQPRRRSFDGGGGGGSSSGSAGGARDGGAAGLLSAHATLSEYLGELLLPPPEWLAAGSGPPTVMLCTGERPGHGALGARASRLAASVCARAGARAACLLPPANPPPPRPTPPAGSPQQPLLAGTVHFFSRGAVLVSRATRLFVFQLTPAHIEGVSVVVSLQFFY
jgi:hypothetical protein